MRTAFLLFLAAPVLTWANSSGAPLNTTGAPGNITCAQAGCHSTFALNSGSGRLSLAAPGGVNSYTPGQTIRMRVTLEDASAARWGFNLTVRKEGSSDFAGAVAVPSTPTPAVVAIRSDGATRFVTHSPNGTFRTQRTQASWEFDWTPPAAGTGPVRFYLAGNAANNSGDEGGDRIYTANLALAEAASTSPGAVTAGNTVLPQFVFGGGWTSSIYFTNPTASQVAFPVRFYSDSAADLEFGGSSTKQLTIPARGTVLIQAPNAGSLSQGWATSDLPAGVVGYGVFRQSAPGVPDQEAVVPFASSSATRASLTYDESNLVTAAAIWFNGPSGATVTMIARDEAGAQIGMSTLAMMPGTKQAFAVVERIPAIAGRRGVLEFSTPSGNLAVLGLRFAGSAFTSIPAAP
jgi:hypothetical protein